MLAAMSPELDARDAAAAEYIPLARAAALAHDRLFPEHPSKDTKTLDVLALALSALVRLYQRDMQTGALRPVTEEELTSGRFTRGAARLEFANREPLRFLVVSREALGSAIDGLAQDTLLAGRLSLTLRQSPRTRPTP
jgi:hypothetical protein